MFDFRKLFNSSFSTDIGIDLGTANTLVYVKGVGIVLDEPSVVALNRKTGRVVAVGTDAKLMYGRTPGHIEVIRPLVDGVISDFEVTEEMLRYLVRKAAKSLKKPVNIRPRVVVGVPSGITNVEIRAVIEATRNAGASSVFIIEEPMAAAVGIGCPIHEPKGSMVVDIGGGTTDIAAISIGGIVESKNMIVAGDKLTEDVVRFLRNEFRVVVGERTAENVKIALATMYPDEQPREYSIRGRDLVTGLPREIAVTSHDVYEAILSSVTEIAAGAREVVEATPPELIADITRRGIYLVGGGALIGGLDRFLQEKLTIKVVVAQEPLSAVARGTGIVLDDIDNYKEILISEHDELPPR